jgi:hypothetical protein
LSMTTLSKRLYGIYLHHGWELLLNTDLLQ